MHKDTNILIIGCGGIGTEIIKICNLNKQLKLTLVDFDRIEYSNLNRQFIFTKEDIGTHKVVAMERFYKETLPDANIEIITENIIGEKFSIEYLNQFSIIFNCLDNLQARTYISKRFFLAKKYYQSSSILIDGGSGGYFGQARFFNGTSCYDCLDLKDTGDNFTVCTIRNVPTTFHHCVIWAGEHIERQIKRVKGIPKSHAIHMLACERASEFKINKENIFFTEKILNNIIPTLASTNSIIASLMFLAIEKQTNIFLGDDSIFTMPLEQNSRCKFCVQPILIIYYSKTIDFEEIKDYLNIKDKLHFIDEFNNLVLNIEKTIQSNQFYILNGKYNLYFLKGKEFEIIEN